MIISRLRKLANAPMFSGVTMQEDLDAIKERAPKLFKKPYKCIIFGDENKATSNFYGIQHYWKELEFPLYYVAEIFKWQNMETNIDFPVVIIHELNTDGSVRTKFFEITILKCHYNEAEIVAKLNSTTLNTRNIYFLDFCLSWNESKIELDFYWQAQKKLNQDRNKL